MNKRIAESELQGKKVYVLANGCHESFIDAAMVQEHLRKYYNCVDVENPREADVILFLGCSVMQTKEDQTQEIIGRLKEIKAQGARLIVTGCISKVRPDFIGTEAPPTAFGDELEKILRLEFDGEAETAHFPYRPYREDQEELISQAKRRSREKRFVEAPRSSKGVLNRLIRPFASASLGLANRYNKYLQSRIDVWSPNTFTIKISTGCSGGCSYCSIKQSRGDVNSRPIEDVLRDFRRGLNQGYKKFALIGTDIGDYGKDRGESLEGLLDALAGLDMDVSLGLRNVNPRWLIPNCQTLCELLGRLSICYIESPIQSCSNKILRLMNRGYTADDYFEAVRQIKRINNKVFIKTQLIAGFPGETEADFKMSQKLYDNKLFDYVDVFPYTDRPNTKARELPDHLSLDVINSRYRRLFYKSLFKLGPKALLRQWRRRTEVLSNVGEEISLARRDAE